MENVIIIVGIVFFFEKEAETLGLCIEVIHASCNCLFTLGHELTFVSWCYLDRLEPLTLSLEEPFMMGFFCYKTYKYKLHSSQCWNLSGFSDH
jgi:hypothetical protein